MKPHRLYVGTIGEGLWRSLDGGVNFTRASDGMFVECHVRALAVHPRNQRVLYLGSEQGLFRSDDGADNWRRSIHRSTACKSGRSSCCRQRLMSSWSARAHPGYSVPTTQGAPGPKPTRACGPIARGSSIRG